MTKVGNLKSFIFTSRCSHVSKAFYSGDNQESDETILAL